LFEYKIHCISIDTELILCEKERKKMRLLYVIWLCYWYYYKYLTLILTFNVVLAFNSNLKEGNLGKFNDV